MGLGNDDICLVGGCGGENRGTGEAGHDENGLQSNADKSVLGVDDLLSEDLDELGQGGFLFTSRVGSGLLNTSVCFLFISLRFLLLPLQNFQLGQQLVPLLLKDADFL